MRNRQRIREITYNDRSGEGLTMNLRVLWRQWRHRNRKMSPKTSTSRTEASVEDIWRVQRIGDNDGGVSGSKTASVDWQWKRSLDFPCYRISNSNTVSSLSCCCLVLILFSSDYFFPCSLQKYYQYCNHTKIFLYQVYTNLAYVSSAYRRVKKLQVLMINKDVRKSLACKKGNEIIIWSWNKSIQIIEINFNNDYITIYYTIC